MDAAERLSFYKRQLVNGIALTAGQQSDMLTIMQDRGMASSEIMAGGGADYDIAVGEL
jgi:hypothetical protein